MKRETCDEVMARYTGMKLNISKPRPHRPETEEDYIGRSVLPPPRRKRTERRKRTPQWELARLVEACRSAPIVWVALCEAAAVRKRRRFGITREELTRRSGILRLPTITAALAALEQAGWIRRSHSYRDGATLLRIALLKYPPNLVRARARKRTISVRPVLLVANDKRSHSSYGRESARVSLTLREWSRVAGKWIRHDAT